MLSPAKHEHEHKLEDVDVDELLLSDLIRLEIPYKESISISEIHH